MNKKLICLILSAVMVLGLISSCASAGADEIDLTDIDVGGMPEVDLGFLIDDIIPLADKPILSLLLLPEASGKKVKKNSSAVIDYSNIADGYVMCAWLAKTNSKLKVIVQGPETKYTYDLKNTGDYETFPLSDGNGKYTVGIYKNTSGTKYSKVVTVTFTAKLTDELAPFLRPNQYVNFNAKSKTVAKAAEVCKKCTTNLEKVKAVYEWVISRLTYDTDKAADIKAGKIKGYIPDVDNILSIRKGICFDYAALMSAMLRSQGVPVKLITGTVKGGGNHAWINVWSETEGWITAAIYFNGETWERMDPTFASSSRKSSSKSAQMVKYIGDGSNYTAKYQY